MKEQITFSQFCDRFKDMDRDNNFSYDGKRALFDYLENYEESTGTEIDLDIIALCCEYNEYKDIEEYLKDYSNQHEVLNFEGFLNEKCPTLLKEYETYKKESIKNGVNLAENIYNWVAYILKKEDIINEFKDKQEEFKNQIEEDITNKTTLIKFKDDLDEGFIISQY